MSRYLDHHRPWLIKDPRLVWFAPLWLERLEQPLCVLLVDLDPWRLAQQLSEGQQQQQQLLQEAVSPYVHLERWTNSTLSALQVCVPCSASRSTSRRCIPAPLLEMIM